MVTHAGKSLLGYGVAIVAVAAAVLCRWLADPWLGDYLPLATIYVAVAFAFWFGGVRPALLAIILGLLVSNYLFIEPRGSLAIDSARESARLIVYFLACGLIVLGSEALRTGRKRLEWGWAKLRESETAQQEIMQQLRIVTDSMAAPVARCSRDLNYLWVSKAYADWIGRPVEEILGHPIEKIIGTSAFAQLQPRFEKVLAGQVERYEEQVNFQVIGPRWINVVYTPTFDPAGVPDGWVAVVIDITERRKLKEALGLSEQRFTQFAQHLPGLAWIKDLRGRYVYVNDGAARVFGRSREDLYGKADADIFPPETAAQFQANDHKAIESNTGVQIIETLKHDDGTIHQSIVSKFPIVGQDGKPLLIGGMAIDITDRLLADEMRAESQERFRQLAESINEVFWLADPSTTEILYVGPAYERVWGRTCQSLYEQPRSFLDAVHPEDAERVRIAVVEKHSRGEPTDEEYRVNRPDGSMRWVRDRAFPVRDAAGRVYRMAGIAEDVTEKKQSDEAIHSLLRVGEKLNSTLDLEELLDILVDEAIRLIGAESGVSGLSSPEGMVCRRYSQRGRRLPLEYCWPPMHGLPGWLLVNKIPYLTNDAMADTQIVHELCVQFGVRNALSTPILSAPGDVLGFFEIHNKTGGFTSSDREKLLAVSHSASIAIQNALAYRRIQQTEESLRHADRRKDEFLATLAHELRNPLAPIRNAVELLQFADKDATVLELARGIMDRQLSQMVRLIDDLLDISRITRGKLQLRSEGVELASVVRNAVEASRPHIESQSHELTVTLPTESVFLNADRIRLSQVISNLLNNAAKFTEKGGHIWLTAERQGIEVAVSVRDTGIGIGPEHLPEVFEMFSQATPALERSQGGLGIGLAVVPRIGGIARRQSRGPQPRRGQGE